MTIILSFQLLNLIRYVDGSTFPRHLLLMVDTSGSMYGFPMKLARIVAEKLIHTLSEHDLVNIIVYNSSHVTGPSSGFSGLVRAIPEIKEQVSFNLCRM